MTLTDLRAPALAVDNLHIAFGGVTAVDGFSLEAECGAITGLIGPNGAGKTTTFNACSGILRPDRGDIQLLGQTVTNFGPARRARLGLGRTFQRMELFASMSVRQNVSMGPDARFGGNSAWRQLRGTTLEKQKVSAATDDAIHVCGIERLADRSIGELSTGQRRLVELARVIAGGFEVLLLDEPCSGLDRSESDAMAELLLRLVAERGTAILLVEHDMEVALAVCSKVFVLDFGKPLFHGTPSEVRRSDVVRRAYLGDELGDAV